MVDIQVRLYDNWTSFNFEVSEEKYVARERHELIKQRLSNFKELIELKVQSAQDLITLEVKKIDEIFFCVQKNVDCLLSAIRTLAEES